MRSPEFFPDPNYKINPDHPRASYAELLKSVYVPLVDIIDQTTGSNVPVAIVEPGQTLPEKGTVLILNNSNPI